MQFVSLQAVTTLTEWSVRTIRRRIADGTLQCATDEQVYYKTMIYFDSIKSNLCVDLTPKDIQLIEAADAGDANAQTDLALLFLEQNKPKSAIYWLELAAKQQVADAMQLLGRCYLGGCGLTKNENLALMWIAKAASLGHSIAMEQIQSIRLS